jgi:hypothetical protein
MNVVALAGRRRAMPEPTSIGGSARLHPSSTFSRTPEIFMNHWPVQLTLIDSSYTQGAPAELGMLATDFPEEPPQEITIYDVSWVKAEPKLLASVSHQESESGPRRRVCYRSTTPVTAGFLRYLNYVLTYPHAARRLAIQPIG